MRATPTTGGAEYVTLQKYFLTSKFRYSRLFRNPTHQTENGTCKYVGTTNSKPAGPIIMFGQSKIGSSSQIRTTLLKFTHLLIPELSSTVGFMIITLDKSQICELHSHHLPLSRGFLVNVTPRNFRFKLDQSQMVAGKKYIIITRLQFYML
jgi:hypothetical protein